MIAFSRSATHTKQCPAAKVYPVFPPIRHSPDHKSENEGIGVNRLSPKKSLQTLYTAYIKVAIQLHRSLAVTGQQTGIQKIFYYLNLEQRVSRTHLLERSYARGTRYGFDRARWRGLWRVQIQEYLISPVQNIQVLLRYGSYLKRSPSVMMEQVKGAMAREIRPFLDFKELMNSRIGRMVLFGFTYPRLSFIET
jgi:hypothetical protein